MKTCLSLSFITIPSYLAFSVNILGQVTLKLTYMVQGLTVKEMEELRDDIKMHLDLDRATPTHVEYWEVLSFFSLLSLVIYSDSVLNIYYIYFF